MNKLRLFPYLLAFILVNIFAVYLFDVPSYISGAPDLVKEYYHDNMFKTLLLDFVLVAAYIAVAMFVVDKIGLEHDEYGKQVLTVAIVSSMISSIFMFYFRSGAMIGSFFQRWFDRVGTKALLYDAVIVSLIYAVMISVS